jgi:hypothetical protein
MDYTKCSDNNPQVDPFVFIPPDAPVTDRPYPQKHAAIITLPGGRHANDVRALAAGSRPGWVFCATAHGLLAVRQEFVPQVSLSQLPPEWTPPCDVERLDEGLPSRDVKDIRADRHGTLWAATLEGVARCDGRVWEALWSDTLDRGFGATMSVWPDATGFWVITSRQGLGWVEEGRWTPVALPEEVGRPLRVDPATSGVWVSGSQGVAWVLPNGCCQVARALGYQVRRVQEQAGTAYLATSRGLARAQPDGVADMIPGLAVPVEDTRDLLLTSDGEVWAATSRGVWSHLPGEPRLHYYHSRRYLPHSYCRSLLQSPTGSIWVATAAGLAHLAELPHTLEAKASRFEYRVRTRHQRLDGYVASSRLATPGDLSSNVPQPSDNDGLWTAMYLAAQCYRYSVTQEDEALRFARQAFAAMERLEAVTTIPGFPTKAIIRPDDPLQHQTHVAWLPSADGQWLWKADCSSDEIVGHLYGYSLYYDLAADEAERQRVRALVDRIMSHILDHGYLIIGPDGKHTQWGVWAPEFLNGPWKAQQGLNSLEILSHLRAAFHITGRKRYMEAYDSLIEEHHYAKNTRRQKIDVPGHVNHSDDELAFLSYYPLLKYEDDPQLRAIYLDSLEHNWQIERPERNPLWNMIYGVLTGRECDLEQAIRTLREIPVDLIRWEVDHSSRLDIALDAESGRFGELQTVGVLPYDELAAAKWNRNPYRAVDGDGGHSEDDGTFYLLPYWMGRYYRLIR